MPGVQLQTQPLFVFFFLATPHSTWDLPRPATKPTPPAQGARSLNHWTTRDAPQTQILDERSSNTTSLMQSVHGWREFELCFVTYHRELQNMCIKGTSELLPLTTTAANNTFSNSPLTCPPQRTHTLSQLLTQTNSNSLALEEPHLHRWWQWSANEQGNICLQQLVFSTEPYLNHQKDTKFNRD